MSVGTAFHERTAPLNLKLSWREWSGYLAAGVYADHHDIEYNAIREAAALIDVSPLFKYRVSGVDSTRLIDRIITRDATKLAVGGVIYTCWCNEAGKVVDDGTIARIDETTYRWTAADPSLRWFQQAAAGLDVAIEDVTDEVAALAVQGPRSRSLLEAVTGGDLSDLRYYRRRAASIDDVRVDVSRTGYTGDLGYELWVDAADALAVWDALMVAGPDHALRPAGMVALDIARIEAGLILIEVDFFSARHALIPEQAYSPFEIGLGRLVNFNKEADFVGRPALEAERDSGGPPRRLVGLVLDWEELQRLYERHDLPPLVPATASREPVPVYSRGRQLGRVTSTTWSPTLKQMIALGSVPPDHEAAGTRLQVEWTVEARRHRVSAEVVPLPFFDPPRKKEVRRS
ncbi:MAG: aminomethyltransferase family protein [Actinomycetota bacterium]